MGSVFFQICKVQRLIFPWFISDTFHSFNSEMDLELHGKTDDIINRTLAKHRKKPKPMWLRVQESEFEQSQSLQGNEVSNPTEVDENVKNLSVIRRNLIQAQTELKNDNASSGQTRNKAKTVKTRENFAKSVKKYFWEAYLKDSEPSNEMNSSSYWNDP